MSTGDLVRHIDVEDTDALRNFCVVGSLLACSTSSYTSKLIDYESGNQLMLYSHGDNDVLFVSLSSNQQYDVTETNFDVVDTNTLHHVSNTAGARKAHGSPSKALY